MGGQGNFTSQVYLTSLCFVPLGLASSIAGRLFWYNSDLFGASANAVVIAALLVVVVCYLVYLTRIFRVVYGLGILRALAAAFVPLLLLFLPVILAAHVSFGPRAENY